MLYSAADFGAAVRLARRKSNFTQAHLGERLGVTRMTISRLEQGDSVSIDTAIRALSECGYALALAPKFSRLIVDDPATGGAEPG